MYKKVEYGIAFKDKYDIMCISIFGFFNVFFCKKEVCTIKLYN